MISTPQFRPTFSALRRQFVALFCVGAFSLLCCQSASAIILSFGSITTNGVGSPEIGEAQLFVEALDVAGDASFRFFNLGPANSNISEIYFDDGSLLGISSIIDNPPSVDFELGAMPANLPSGSNADPDFEVTSGDPGLVGKTLVSENCWVDFGTDPNVSSASFTVGSTSTGGRISFSLKTTQAVIVLVPGGYVVTIEANGAAVVTYDGLVVNSGTISGGQIVDG